MRLGRKIFWGFVILWLVLTAFLFFLSDKWAGAAPMANSRNKQASVVTAENFETMLRQSLENNPQILLDFLEKHSEAVLDIAQQGSNQRRHRALRSQWENDLKIPKSPAISGKPVMGNPEAPVTIVAFSDFTCPYCKQAYETVRQIMVQYADQVRYVFMHYPLENSGMARKAAEFHVAASFQGADKAWMLYEILFQRSDDIIENGSKALVDAAKEVGLDMDQLSKDLKKKSTAAIVDADMAEGERLGVQGTPYFLVNDLILRGALSPDIFAEAIQMALQASKKK